MIELRLEKGVQLFLITLKYRKYFTTASTAASIIGFGRPQTLKVSTTRGTPSTSLILKEAMCEKIAVHHDLIRKFRLRHGASVVSEITVDDLYQGLAGVRTTVKETSEIDEKLGVKYRGLTIPEVISLLPRRGGSPCPEAVFWLLLTGDIPTYEQTASLTADWTSRRQRQRERWFDKGGGVLEGVLKTLPKTVSPLGRLCVALTTLSAEQHTREALKNRPMAHTHWEFAYEDCMEVLAILPAIVGLVSKVRDLSNFGADGDWVDVLLECLGNIVGDEKVNKSSLGDFLRLYITVNADEDGSSPGSRATQIIADAVLDPSQALAAGVLAYADEPKGGSMIKYMEFQKKLQSTLGSKPTKNAVKNYLGFLLDRQDGLVCYKESEYCDPRYIMLRNYAREQIPEAPEVELSRTISKVFIPMMKQAKAKNSWPEQNAIAAPIFQCYGLRDMEFNQVLLCMSRALGAIASMIWARAMCVPVENPRSNSTYTYMRTVKKSDEKNWRRYPVKQFKRFGKK